MTIKVGELREINKNNDKVEEVEFGDLKIKVNQYTAMQTKRTIAETIAQASFIQDRDTGLNMFDRGLAEATWGYLIVKHYTNINNMKDPFDMYDTVEGNNILKVIEMGIPENEFELLVSIVENRIEEAFRLEEVTMSIAYRLEGIVDILIGKMGESLDTIKDFDSSELKMMTDLIKIEDKEVANDNVTELK